LAVVLIHLRFVDPLAEGRRLALVFLLGGVWVAKFGNLLMSIVTVRMPVVES